MNTTDKKNVDGLSAIERYLIADINAHTFRILKTTPDGFSLAGFFSSEVKANIELIRLRREYPDNKFHLIEVETIGSVINIHY